jgi:hypothetical protein
MIDKDKQVVYYTPVYHVLSQLSRTIRPGDRAVKTSKIFLKALKMILCTAAPLLMRMIF